MPVFQALGKHARAQAAHHVLNLAETVGAGQQHPEDQARPALADDVDGPLVTRAELLTEVFAHGRVASALTFVY